MKTRIASLLALPAIVLAAVTLTTTTGCRTTSGDCPPGDLACLEAKRMANLESWALDLQDLATAGTALAVADGRTSEVDTLRRVVAVLDALAESDTLTVQAIANAVREAGVLEINSPEGILAFTAGKIVFRRTLGDDVVRTPAEALLFLNAIRHGIRDGLPAGAIL